MHIHSEKIYHDQAKSSFCHCICSSSAENSPFFVSIQRDIILFDTHGAAQMSVSRHQAILLEKELAFPSLAHLVSLNGIHWHGFAKLITFQSLVTNNKPLCQTLIFCFLPDVMHLLLFIRFNPIWLLQCSKQSCGSWK